jgi:hypothetical protein
MKLRGDIPADIAGVADGMKLWPFAQGRSSPNFLGPLLTRAVMCEQRT